MRYMHCVILCCLAVFLLTGVAIATSPAPERESDGNPYTIAVIPFYSPEKIWTLFSPFVQYLKKTTGMSWELKLYPTHDAVIEAFCDGKVAVTLLGPVPLGRAYKKCGALPILIPLGNDKKPFYRSIIVTNDPSIQTLDGLRGKRIGYFKGSTAAHIVPAMILKNAGLGANTYQSFFFESQDRILTKLLAGEIDGAGLKESLFRKFNRPPLRILKVSDPMPNFAFCAKPSWQTPARKAFISALRKLNPAENTLHAEVVKNWDDEIKNGFVLPDKRFLPDSLRVYEMYEEMARDAR